MKWFWAAAGLIIIFLAGFSFMKKDAAELKKIKLNGVEISVEVADADAERKLGLSGRDSLAESQGMLFVFESEAMLSFWMKDMRFAIDIIWLDQDKTVVDITENATPESYPQRFSPKTPSKYALEVPAGFAARHGIATGDKMK